MAKVELDDAVIDKLIGKRVTALNKTIKGLESKVKTRDNKIHKLKREVELLSADRMADDKKTADNIAKVARLLVGELQRANWVEKFYECGAEHCADTDD
jgi:hypothetical protein